MAAEECTPQLLVDNSVTRSTFYFNYSYFNDMQAQHPQVDEKLGDVLTQLVS